MKNIFAMAAVAAAIFLAFSCEKDGDGVKHHNLTVKADTVDANIWTAINWSTWTYYSFDNGVVTVEDRDTDMSQDMDWDIAFHLYSVKTNSGTSGEGQGGAYLIPGATSLSSVLPDPSGVTFVTDVADGVTNNFGIDMMHSVSETVSGSAELSKWITVVTGHGAPSTTFEANKVFYVRTADGRLVVMRFTDYNKVEPGSSPQYYFPSFEFAFIE